MKQVSPTDSRTIRIGLFGGTFNPIHYGHLRSAVEVTAALGLARVIFVPAAQPPHKKQTDIISFHHRLAMAKAAVAPVSYLDTWDVEGKRPGPSFTVDTIREFHRLNQGRAVPYLIIGLDSFLEINTWKDYQIIFSLTNLVVTTRPGYRQAADPLGYLSQITPGTAWAEKDGRFVHPSGHTICFQPITGLFISATRLREMVGTGLPITFLTPPVVEEYIQKHQLYTATLTDCAARPPDGD
ncbi:MAG: nicotinate (nicotinamide) nucleotide adenylyltransferase [Deltaproteobacteria bacterium]|nr:nicotinate (nicotinamide) nucleotide adenylyltransferase [Deltaproteobacteria bacterium]